MRVVIAVAVSSLERKVELHAARKGRTNLAIIYFLEAARIIRKREERDSGHRVYE